MNTYGLPQDHLQISGLYPNIQPVANFCLMNVALGIPPHSQRSAIAFYTTAV
jgi:hypothetical protein